MSPLKFVLTNTTNRYLNNYGPKKSKNNEQDLGLYETTIIYR